MGNLASMRVGTRALFAWTFVGVVVTATLLSPIYYHLIIPLPLGRTVTFGAIYLWQLAGWSIWLVLGPLAFRLGEWLTERQGGRAGVVAIHLAAVVAVVIVHAAWFGAVSTQLSPYKTLVYFRGALIFFTRFAAPVDVALYAALVAGASRTLLRAALSEAAREYQAIFENAVVGIFRASPQGRLSILNDAGAQILGYPSAQEALASIDNLDTQVYSDPGERARYLSELEAAGAVSNRLIELRRRDGERIWVNESARAVRDSDGALASVEGMFVEVTAEVAAREALRESERRATELRIQLASAELRALKLQLRPHFLFNILNTVAMMIRTGQTEKARTVVTMVGDMFRSLLELEGVDWVPLERELAFLDLYLGLEQYRYDNRMTVSRDVDADALAFPVPTLLLQPIIENAIKHGVGRSSEKCAIDIRARRSTDGLCIEIVNDIGAVPDVGTDDDVIGHGIGIKNTRMRMRELYGDAGSFELVRDGDRMRASFLIPFSEEAAP